MSVGGGWHSVAPKRDLQGVAGLVMVGQQQISGAEAIALSGPNEQIEGFVAGGPAEVDVLTIEDGFAPGSMTAVEWI